MKSWLIALSLALAGAGVSLTPVDAEARRLGSGRPAGLQRQAPPPAPPANAQPSTAPNQASPGAQQAAPVTGAAAAGTAAAAGKRSWAGPIAGLAAGLGIAALLSHFGLGEAFANLLTMLLLAGLAFFVLRFVMRRMFGRGLTAPGGRLAAAGASAGTHASATPRSWQQAPLERRDALGGVAPVSAPVPAAGNAPSGASAGAVALPPDIDAQSFERIAKMIFIRLQAANDAGAVDDLRRFTTPELFASLRLDLQERAGASQQTDVVQLDAEILETAQEDGQWIVSVRFHGLIREEAGGVAEPFDEVWHLVRPLDGQRDWAIAGITPVASPH